MPITGEQVKVEYRSRSNFDSITKDPNTLYFVEESNGKFTICVGNKELNHANSSHTHGISDIANLQTTLDDKIEWTQVWSGAVNLNSHTSSFYSATVPSNSYVGKRIAIEVQYGSGTTYTSKIIFGVLGSSSAITASTSISRGIGWNYFDGTNLRVKTLYAYTPTGNTTRIYVGYLKTLFGTFSGTEIEWSTSHSETLYMKKIWVIE